jgi:hypothetical protein
LFHVPCVFPGHLFHVHCQYNYSLCNSQRVKLK